MSSGASCTSGSSLMHSTDGSSETSASHSHSDSYTTTSYSTVDPPSHLEMKHGIPATMSAMSDPSASSASASNKHNQPTSVMSVFTPVLEETSSALEVEVEVEDDSSSAYAVESRFITTNSNVSSGAGSNTRTSIDANGVNIEITSSSLPSSPAGPTLPLECDYDENPTELYQAIESKKWDRIASLFDDAPAQTRKQAATWVTRKETSGKLRWRLLPIHAAVIFQSPSSIVERLLLECPEAARARDDQGMLPLHLAFRTKNTDWETIEELISSNPQAIFSKDRKGRTPLECGTAAAQAAIAAAEAEMQPAPVAPSSSLLSVMSKKGKAKGEVPSNGPSADPKVQRAIFSVMELYSQITVQDQLQSANNASRKALESRIGAVQDGHVATLTQLKKDWEDQRHDLNMKIQGHRREIQSLKSDFVVQQELLEEKVKTEMELVDKLQKVTTALEATTGMNDRAVGVVARDLSSMHTAELDQANQKVDSMKRQNKELLLLLETLLDQQNSLKLSLDKLAWDQSAKNQERKELLNKYMVSNEQSTEMAQSYTTEWQSRLEQTSIDISNRLSKVLRDHTVDEYDGEEKKESSHNILVHSVDSGLSGSRQDP